MEHSVARALFSFTERYQQAWQAEGYALPQDDQLSGYASPCVERDSGLDVSWQRVARQALADFDNVEQAIELRLHEDIKVFYGSQYAADMPAQFRQHPLTLLQVWSDEDLPRLQENMLGHLVMQRRLKLKPTMFIAAIDNDEQKLISICNLSGEVILETLGRGEHEVLSDSVEDFLAELTPRVVA
ncbi:SecY-interacting protein [Thaumasiovibrio subtropicus]|uniref:SecY-interacting protein n=1 Tax=Thaumasiovibrio subtropicus TaxID=1891207 RepID=UPI000B35A497|nr:SecY-interacting protein [Thaumasiovibrio subtropicus]